MSRTEDAYIAMLEDAVVAAACVVFDQVPSESEEGYLTEGLHEMALDICRSVPRLRGAFKDAS